MGKEGKLEFLKSMALVIEKSQRDEILVENELDF